MKIKVQCSGELHEVTIHPGRSVTIDPSNHDPELEAGLAELGAELPMCVLLAGDDQQAKMDVCNMANVSPETIFALAMTMDDADRCAIATNQTTYVIPPTLRFRLAMTCDDETKRRVAMEALGLTGDQRHELAMAAEGEDTAYSVAVFADGLTPQQRFDLIEVIHDGDLRAEAARIAPDLDDDQRLRLLEDADSLQEEMWSRFGHEEDDTPELDFDL
jgi:hypothetical protein